MTLNDLAKAHVRTIVPAVVGLIITLALRAGIDLHGYAPFITTAVTAAYYSAARLAEARLDPRFGWLLGVAASPQYVRQMKGTRLPKARPTGSTSHHTVVLHADTGQFLAELNLAEAQTKKAAMAAKKARKAAPKDRGESFVWFLLATLAVCAGFLLAHAVLQAV